MPDALPLIDRVDDLIHHAQPVPLMEEVRVDPAEALAIVAELHAVLATELPPGSQPAEIAGELDRCFAQAKRLPLTDQVRIDKETVYDLLDRMRLAYPEAWRAERERQAELEPDEVANRVTLEEASASFEALAHRAAYGGESFVVEAGGTPLVEIRPATPR